MESKTVGHFVAGWVVTALIMSACIGWQYEFQPPSEVASGAFTGIAVSLVAVILVGIFTAGKE